MSDTYNQRQWVEQLIGHLVASPEVFKRAQAVGMTPDDFLPPGGFELPAMKLLVATIFEMVSAPVSSSLLILKLDDKIKTGQIPEHLSEEIMLTVARAYHIGDLSVPYFLEEIPKFIRARRAAKIMLESSGDLDHIHQRYQEVIFPLDSISSLNAPVEDRFVSPFETVLKKMLYSMISTGFTSLDAALGGGLGYGEMGLIIGHSGGGKSAMGVSFARGAALSGHKAIYCSMEEAKEDIANRMYAAVFQVDYTSLHNGSGYMALEEKFASDAEADKRELLKENLRVLDLKDLTPMKSATLKQLLDDYVKKTGFIYELVIVDQLQFMEPNIPIAGEQEWQKEQRVVRELDAESHKEVGGEAGRHFGMWVLHQAKGKVKLNFSTDEIAGFKGVTHKPETVLGLGREDPASDVFELFSLKNRHAKGFRQPMHGDLTFMRFIEGPPPSTTAPSPEGTVKPVVAVQSPMTSGNFDAPVLPSLFQGSAPVQPAVGLPPLVPLPTH